MEYDASAEFGFGFTIYDFGFSIYDFGYGNYTKMQHAKVLKSTS